MLITKGQSILDRKKKKERQRSLSNEERANGETNGNCSFVSWRTVFCRSDVIRKVLQPPRPLDPPPTREGARRTRVILEARITAPLSAFIKAGLSFFLSLLISSPALPRRKLRSSFSSTTRKESTPSPCSSDGVCIGCGSRFFPRLLHPRRARNKEDKQRVDVTS